MASPRLERRQRGLRTEPWEHQWLGSVRRKKRAPSGREERLQMEVVVGVLGPGRG